MKTPILFIMTLILTLAGFSGGYAMAAENTDAMQSITRFGTLPAYKGSSQYFTGTAWVQPLFEAKFPQCPITGAYVTFEPGARSHWHEHPVGQHLIATAGIGFTGTEDGKVQEFRAGDVIWCPPGVKHWHGAALHSSMTHFAFTGTLPEGMNTKWLEPVTDEEYNSRK
jgi:quercetin dioxygenase-like cupin family protein